MPHYLQQWLQLIPVILIVLGLLIHLLFAMAVYADANRIDHGVEPLMFVDSRTWAASVGVFGLLALLIYWLIHHSSLRPAMQKSVSTNSDNHHKQPPYYP